MKHNFIEAIPLLILASLLSSNLRPAAAHGASPKGEISVPYLQTNHREIDRAFRIAVGDLMGNVGMHQS